MSDGNWFTRFMTKEVGAISLRVASAACYGATAAAAVVTVLIVAVNLRDSEFSQVAIPGVGAFACTYVLAMLATHFRNLARTAEAEAASDHTLELIGSSATPVELPSAASIPSAGSIAAATVVELPGAAPSPSAGIDTPL